MTVNQLSYSSHALKYGDFWLNCNFAEIENFLTHYLLLTIEWTKVI